MSAHRSRSILPALHQSQPKEVSVRGPERQLLLAMLKRAIIDFHSNDRTSSEDARDWFFDTEEVDTEVFSFSWVCDQLNLSKSALQARLRKYRELKHAINLRELPILRMA